MTTNRLQRRDVLGLGGMAMAATASGLCVPTRFANAAAEPAGTQAPAYFRFMVGDFEVTSVSDGSLYLEPATLLSPSAPEAELLGLLEQNFLPTDHIVSPVNLTLVNTGEQLVLFDAGSGLNFQPSAGKVVDTLEAAGLSPDDIDLVVMTHAHPDHCWGLIDDFVEEPRFANAAYVIGETEWDFWTSEETLASMPDEGKPFVLGAQRNLKPLAADVERIADGAEIVPGITAISTPGHTPGHMSYLIASGEDQLIVTGDVVNHAYVSFQRPDWAFGFDADQELAPKTRRALLDRAASDRVLVLGYHLPFPGVGHVAAEGDAFRFVPKPWVYEL